MIPDPPADCRSFPDIVVYCAGISEFVREWERLTGHKLTAPPRSTIEAMVDKAAGYQWEPDEEAVRAFIVFVKEAVWDRLPPEAFESR